jgi:phage repressor protein C with HTH and peptisase S24 domain
MFLAHDAIFAFIAKLSSLAFRHFGYRLFRHSKVSVETMSKVHEEQRRWLADELKKRGWGAKSALAAYLRVRNDAITRILTESNDRPYREISFEELAKMAEFFGSTPPGLSSLVANTPHHEISIDKSGSEQNLAGNLDERPANTTNATSRSPGTIVPQAELVGTRDLPVFGISQIDKGLGMLSVAAVEFASRPEPLLKVPEGYGIIVADDTMSPEHSTGSTALVHPHLPAQVGDTCLFRRVNADGRTEVLIRKLVRITPTSWHVLQYEPRHNVALKRSDWDDCHVTVGNYKRR